MHLFFCPKIRLNQKMIYRNRIKYFDIDKKYAVSYNGLMMRLLCLRFPRRTEERNGSQLQQIMETNDR